MRITTLLLFAFTISLSGQKAVIREVVRPVTTYPYSDPDPVPKPGRTYPYFRFDGYTNKSILVNWKMIELENEYIRLAVMPEIGGKVWAACEKSQDYPFVFTTKAVKFRDIALRGPWTTGGLEFNFGDIGHATTCSTPVDYFTRTNSDGSVSCFIGVTEWASRTTWRVEIRLEPDKAYFITRSWYYNGTPFEQELYHWINAGFKASGNLEFIFPGTHHVGHGGELGLWPVDTAGREISFYRNNNFGSYKSYHIFGRPSDFYGGFWHDDNMGFGRYSPYYEKLGRKVWILGLSQEGTRWENLLGDNDGLNVELQSGRLFTQASESSMFTPFKHVGFSPFATDTWSDMWFPVKHTRGMTHACSRGALNLRSEEGWLKIDWMSLEHQQDSLIILDGRLPLISCYLNLHPLDTFRDSVKWNGNTDRLMAKIGSDLISDGSVSAIKRPLKSPSDFDWQSEYGLFLRGDDLSKQKNYQEAETYFLKALGKNPGLVPALVQMSQIRFRQGLYAEARDYAGKALAINTYDPWANYFWGLASDKAGFSSDATDGFSVATIDPSVRPAALLNLTRLAIRQKNLNRAINLVDKCIGSNPENEEALILKALITRISGENKTSLNYLNEILEKNPLCHHARFEKYLNTENITDRNDFINLIRQEMPHETFVELAINYYELKLNREALKVLDLAPRNPMVELWQAFIMNSEGQKEDAKRLLISAAQASPVLVFPFRTEMIPLFSWADSIKASWKWRYYEALIHWQNSLNDKAGALFMACGEEPDFVPFYIAKARFFTDTAIIKASLEKAYEMNPEFRRTGIDLAKFYAGSGDPLKALLIAGKNYKTHPESFAAGLQYAQMQVLNQKYTEALMTLKGLEMLPAEGDVNAHTLFRQTNTLLALDLIRERKWRKAVQYLNEAEKWPENLFSGEPYMPDNRVTRFITAYCLEKLNRRKEAETAINYIKDYRNPDGRTYKSGDKLTQLLSSGNHEYINTLKMMLENPGSDRDKEVLVKFLELL
jgi:tetratricopeptide (TPR) repeat protein